MSYDWILIKDELPNTYEEVEILLTDGRIRKDMIIRGRYGNLEWRNYTNSSVKTWREINR